LSKEEENKREDEEEQQEKDRLEELNSRWLHELEQQQAEIEYYALQTSVFYCALIKNGVKPDHACGMTCAKITSETKGDLE